MARCRNAAAYPQLDWPAVVRRIQRHQMVARAALREERDDVGIVRVDARRPLPAAIIAACASMAHEVPCRLEAGDEHQGRVPEPHSGNNQRERRKHGSSAEKDAPQKAWKMGHRRTMSGRCRMEKGAYRVRTVVLRPIFRPCHLLIFSTSPAWLSLAVWSCRSMIPAPGRNGSPCALPGGQARDRTGLGQVRPGQGERRPPGRSPGSPVSTFLRDR